MFGRKRRSVPEEVVEHYRTGSAIVRLDSIVDRLELLTDRLEKVVEETPDPLPLTPIKTSRPRK